MRKPLIAANWKMNSAPATALQKDGPYHSTPTVDVMVFPSFLDISRCLQAGIITGGQYGYVQPHGAHTGDISMQMLKDSGCTHVLCGHSERRMKYHETDADIALQVEAALSTGLHPVVCIGETGPQRDHNQQEAVILRQVALLPREADITIAYEPVWAIGSGQACNATIAQRMHALIRDQLPKARKNTTRILYGGSMKPENATELLQQEDIDGGLVGGASLQPDSFKEIVAIAHSL